MTKSTGSKVICVLPSVCGRGSNGIAALCQTYRFLRENITSTVFFVCSSDHSPTLKTYRKWFGRELITYSKPEEESALESITKTDFVLVRPDDLEGIANPIHWELARSPAARVIINLLLAPPFVFSINRSILEYYGKKDYFLLLNQALMPAFSGLEKLDLFIETTLDPLIKDFVNTQARSKSDPVSVYLGKGIARGIPDFRQALENCASATPENLIFIKRHWPRYPEDLYSLLAASRCLISFDPFSHIERVSTYLGTPVLKIPEFNLRNPPGVAIVGDSLVESIAPLEHPLNIHAESASHYRKALANTSANLSTIASAVETASRTGSEGLMAQEKVVHFSRECLYSFSSQFRHLLPISGAISMPNDNESLERHVLFELLTCAESSESLSMPALAYKRKAERSQAAAPCAGRMQGREKIFYQFAPRSPNPAASGAQSYSGPSNITGRWEFVADRAAACPAD